MRINLYEILQQVLNEGIASEIDVNHAIDDKCRVIINYNDEGNEDGSGRAEGERYIEPYVYGLTLKGNPCIRAYQYRGSSFRGAPQWKLFLVSRITNWVETDDHFVITPRENGWDAAEYNRNGDKSMSQIFNMVKLEDFNPDNLYSPNDTLYTNRKKAAQTKASKPMNIYDVSKSKDGAIPNSTTSSVMSNKPNNINGIDYESDFNKVRANIDKSIADRENAYKEKMRKQHKKIDDHPLLHLGKGETWNSERVIPKDGETQKQAYERMRREKKAQERAEKIEKQDEEEALKKLGF